MRKLSITLIALALLAALPFAIISFGVAGFLGWLIVVMLAHVATKE